jgi:hypothetical protein
MLGDLIRKLLNKDQPGMQRTTMRDASELPAGMKVESNPVPYQAFEDGVNSGALRKLNNFGATNPPLPQGMDFSRRFMNVPNDEGIRNVSGGDLQGSLSDYYRLKY